MRRLERRLALWALLGAWWTLTGCATAPEVEPVPEESVVPRIFLEPAERAVLPAGVEVRKVYDPGLRLTASMEGFRGKLYNDPVGYCTIGYGHLIKMSRCDGTEPDHFRKGLSRPAGLDLLRQDMEMAEVAVMKMVRVDLTDGQYAALCDFVYNTGPSRLKKSDLLKYVNAGQLDRVPFEFRRYVKANKKVMAGLVQRREKEIELFFEGLGTPRAVPAEGELELIDITEEEEE